MATAAEPQPAVLPLPGGVKDATVKLHPLLSGVSLGPKAWIHREEGRLAGLHALGFFVSKTDMMEIPIVSFLVEHPGAGPVLIDTGLHPSCASPAGWRRCARSASASGGATGSRSLSSRSSSSIPARGRS